MIDEIGRPTGNIGTGSSLLMKDIVPLESAEVRSSLPLDVSMVSRLGIDISADKDCTVKIVRMPDGQSDGAVSVVGLVPAGTPAFFLYSSLLCPSVKVVVENTGSGDMTTFSMYIRGGA